MKIYTKTGDKGTTSLFGGMRVEKHNIRIEAYGTVDELNAHLGMLADQPVNQKRGVFLREVQSYLFTIGSHLAAAPGKKLDYLPALDPEYSLKLEKAIDEMDELLTPLQNFILPGGHVAISFCHLARTVCRRAERRCAALHEIEPISEEIIVYLNRLSDYLFTLGRIIAHELNVEEIPWKSKG
jgi:cob(I)alamin adenosyltransferase